MNKPHSQWWKVHNTITVGRVRGKEELARSGYPGLAMINKKIVLSFKLAVLRSITKIYLMNNIEIHIIMIDGPRIDCWTSILHSFSFLLYCFFRIGDGIASAASTLTSACLYKVSFWSWYTESWTRTLFIPFLFFFFQELISSWHSQFSINFAKTFFKEKELPEASKYVGDVTVTVIDCFHHCASGLHPTTGGE